MRFNSPQEVRAWALLAAAGDLKRAEDLYHDPNPYATPGARSDWQRGYDRLGPRSYEPGVEWCLHYQVGLAHHDLQEARVWLSDINASAVGSMVTGAWLSPSAMLASCDS